jgi:hypothetical protein
MEDITLERIYEEAQKSVTRSLVYLEIINRLFAQDVFTCFEYANNSENGDKKYFWYRNTLRAFFSYVDGIVFTLKDIILWAHARSEISLTASELLILKETRPLFQRGKVIEVSQNNPFNVNFEISMIFFPKVFRSDFILNKSDHRYGVFKQTLQYRNSVTHPKKIEDYLLPPEGVKDLRNSIIWFAETMKMLMTSCGEGLKTK